MVQKVLPKRIVIFGPESTGKTTLAKQLAAHYQTVWSPEFVRHYLEARHLPFPEKGYAVETADLKPIVLGQAAAEAFALQAAQRIVFHDTCLYTNIVYIEHYFQQRANWLEVLAGNQQYSLFLLAETDLPWCPDPQREGEAARHLLFDKMHQLLLDRQLPFERLGGNGEGRLQKAIKLIEKQFPIL